MVSLTGTVGETCWCDGGVRTGGDMPVSSTRGRRALLEAELRERSRVVGSDEEAELERCYNVQIYKYMLC